MKTKNSLLYIKNLQETVGAQNSIIDKLNGSLKEKRIFIGKLEADLELRAEVRDKFMGECTRLDKEVKQLKANSATFTLFMNSLEEIHLKIYREWLRLKSSEIVQKELEANKVKE
jgi:hypothetical protein